MYVFCSSKVRVSKQHYDHHHQQHPPGQKRRCSGQKHLDRFDNDDAEDSRSERKNAINVRIVGEVPRVLCSGVSELAPGCPLGTMLQQRGRHECDQNRLQQLSRRVTQNSTTKDIQN